MLSMERCDSPPRSLLRSDGHAHTDRAYTHPHRYSADTRITTSVSSLPATAIAHFTFPCPHHLTWTHPPTTARRRMPARRPPAPPACMQRDVPGMTRGVLPVVTELWWGPVVRAISVGVNGASPAPAVPLNTPFVWRDEATGSQVVAFWHPGGYGGKSDYKGHTIALTPAPDCVRTPAGASGGRHILCFSWRGDNKGPFDDPKEVRHAGGLPPLLLLPLPLLVTPPAHPLL